MNKDIAANDLILNADTLIKIIDKLPHVVFLKDSNRRFLLANKACLAMLNAKAEDVIGKTDHHFFTPSYVKYVNELESDLLKNGGNKITPEERFTDPVGNEQIMKTIRLPLYIPEMDEIGILGIAVNMALEKELEQAIRSKNKQLENQKEEIDEKRKNAEDLYNKVRSSLKFSKFFQDTIIPNKATVKRLLPDSFVMYLPKPITNGDFYWVKEKDGIIYIATIDCREFDAGGTFISMLCYDILSEILKGKDRLMPTEILLELNEGLKANLEQCIDVSKMKERVNINVCVFDKEKYMIEQSGSGAPMLIVNKRTNFLLQPKNEGIGLPFDESIHKFVDNRIKIEKGDSIYMMTDGYALQRSNLDAKQIFGYERLKDLILEISDYTMDKQMDLLARISKDLRGDEEQSDDILLIGVRV
jgi:PAS domain S-box-containing protein